MTIREAEINESTDFSRLYEQVLWESFDYWDRAWKKML